MNRLPKSLTAIYRCNRRKFIQYGSLALGTSIVAACSNGNQPQSQTSPTTASSPDAVGKLDKVTFGTNWVAEAEHGGFYQAIASGIYKDYGLDVTIKMGGPQVPSGTQLLMGGAVDFFMGYGVDAVNAIAEGIPKITVASIFQKDPQCLIAHPNTGVDSLEDLKAGRFIFLLLPMSPIGPLSPTPHWDSTAFLTTGLGVLIFVGLTAFSDLVLRKWHESAVKHEN